MTCRLVAALLGLLALPAGASAHAVGVEAKLAGDTIRVEAFFDDDTPAADAKVAVTAEDGRVIAEGKTDARGVWSFPVPAVGKYRVEVNAGAGHTAKTTITVPPRPAATPPAPAGGDPGPAGGADVTVSEGPTRSEATGPRRWLMAGVGLGVIAALTLAARLLTRRTGPAGHARPG